MIKEIIICDWCMKKRAVTKVINGPDSDDCLCELCMEEFLYYLCQRYTNDIKSNGDWRLATKKIKLITNEDYKNTKPIGQLK